MTTHELLLLIANAVICSGIAIRVGTFRRNGSQHRRWGGGLLTFSLWPPPAFLSVPLTLSGITRQWLPIYRRSSSTLSCLPPF